MQVYSYCLLFFFSVQKLERSPHRVMANVLNSYIVVREFEIQSRYYVHFWANALGKGMNPHILTRYGLNNSTAVLLQGCFDIELFTKVDIPSKKLNQINQKLISIHSDIISKKANSCQNVNRMVKL